MASIVCGECRETHRSVEGVRRCHAGQAGPCGWQYEVRDRWGVVRDEDGGVIIRECDALAWDDGRAQVCENGHEHVWAEARQQEGWEYAEDMDEAMTLARAGVEPRDMEMGRVFV